MKIPEKTTAKKIARIDVRISPDVKDEFSTLCENSGATASEVIREFVHTKISPEQQSACPPAHKKPMTGTITFIVFLVLIISVLMYFSHQTTNATSNKNISPKVISLFKHIDKNQDGSISLEDLQVKKAIIAKNISAGKGPRDFYHRARINAQQLDLLMEPSLQLKYWDKNQDNLLSVEEFAKSSYPFKSARFITLPNLQTLDVNNNAWVSRAELQRYLFQEYDYLENHSFLTTWLTNHLLFRYKANADDKIAIR
jgi:Ca2+-binding EF-hand superfamily protein